MQRLRWAVVRTPRSAMAALVLSGLLWGCQHDLDDKSDPDASVDMRADTRPDTGPDVPAQPDLLPPDRQAADSGEPDLPPPDLPPPDLPPTDLPPPDLPSPDLPPADSGPDQYVPGCGSGKIDPGEKCDGALLGGNTCKSLGYNEGTLKCTSSCALDLSGCSKCNDGLTNGTESDKDCGGLVCSPCKVGGKCNKDSDCGTGFCHKGACHTVSCSDMLKNGAETGVDCGGKTCSRCGVGQGCKSKADCLSGVCTGGACQNGCAHQSVNPSCYSNTTLGVQLCKIPSGCFQMGSPTSEACRTAAPIPVPESLHYVTLTHDFEIMATEVTQAQFLARMGYNNSQFKTCGTSCPVDYVNWHEAAAYCNALTIKMGWSGLCYSCSSSGSSVSCKEATAYSGQLVYSCPGYRLPTEAEREYAHRAGSTKAYHNNGNADNGKCKTCTQKDTNADLIAHYCANAKSTKPVGKKTPNSWGLHDMSGNVWEWCHDVYNSNLGFTAQEDPVGTGSGDRVIRGGGWNNYSYYLRSAYRYHLKSWDRFYNGGLRCVRSIQK